MSSTDPAGPPGMHTTLRHDPTVEHRPAIPHLGSRRTVTTTSMQLVADRISGLVDLVLSRGVTPTGSALLRYEVIDMAHEMVVVAGVPVPEDALDLADRVDDVHRDVLPAGRYVTVVHRGHPDTLVRATADLLAWTRAQGLRFDVRPSPQGEVWGCRVEHYLTDPADEPRMDLWDTELAFRLAD